VLCFGLGLPLPEAFHCKEGQKSGLCKVQANQHLGDNLYQAVHVALYLNITCILDPTSTQSSIFRISLAISLGNPKVGRKACPKKSVCTSALLDVCKWVSLQILT